MKWIGPNYIDMTGGSRHDQRRAWWMLMTIVIEEAGDRAWSMGKNCGICKRPLAPGWAHELGALIAHEPKKRVEDTMKAAEEFIGMTVFHDCPAVRP